MKFLLTAINAKYIHSNPGIYSLSAYVKQREERLRDHIELAEYTINHDLSYILADIYRRKPDAIGFSCYIWNISVVLELAREIKKLLPEITVWLGGPEVSYDAKKLLNEHLFLTGIICGEGEEAFYQLLHFLIEEKDEAEPLSKFGIIMRTQEGIQDIISHKAVDLSELPFLYENFTPFENRIIYYESSRGCPFRCSYCLSSIDKSVRFRDINMVKKELAYFLEHKISQVKFIDRTFNCNKQHTIAVWEYLLENDNGVTNFHFEIAADLLSAEELSLLKRFRPGAVQLEIGVQSTNEITIHEIDRKMDICKLKKVVDTIYENRNIHIHLDLIAGLPYEDYVSFANSFNEVFAMHPDQLQLGFLKVLKGSKMHEKAEDYGLVYRDSAPYEVLFTKWISFDEICRLKRIEEMVEMYYNSNQFLMTLPLAIQRFASPFAFFEALADEFERKGYFIQSPARTYRYEVLLNFLCDTLSLAEEERALFAESLTMDIYLRENCKTRPSFAKDITLYKEKMREFFRKEAQDHEILGGAYESYDARTLARSIHIEPVQFDLQTGRRFAQAEYVIFDYKVQDPLTKQVKTCRWRDKNE